MTTETGEQEGIGDIGIAGFGFDVTEEKDAVRYLIDSTLDIQTQISNLSSLVLSKKDKVLLDYTLLKSSSVKSIRKKIKKLITEDEEVKVIFKGLSAGISLGEDGNFLDMIIDICLKKLDFESKKIVDLSNGGIFENFLSNKESLFERLEKAKNINIGGNEGNIHLLNTDELNIIFSSLKNCTGFDLTGMDLESFSKEQLTAIFSNLQNAEIIDLTETNINLLDSESLEIIFRNTPNVKHWVFTFNVITDEVLQVLSTYAKNSKVIDFTMCDLNPEQQTFIEGALKDTTITYE